MACHVTDLAGNYLTVDVFSRTGKVGVFYAMTQNWQVISHGCCTQQDRQGFGVACHDTELASKSDK